MTHVASNDTIFFEVFDISLGMQNGNLEGFFPDLMGNFDSEVYIIPSIPNLSERSRISSFKVSGRKGVLRKKNHPLHTRVPYICGTPLTPR